MSFHIKQDQQMNQEEKVLSELLKWSKNDDESLKGKNKEKRNLIIFSIILFIVSSVLLYIEPVSKNQIIAFFILLLGIICVFTAFVISGTNNNLEYTAKYIDISGIKKRINEIQNNQTE